MILKEIDSTVIAGLESAMSLNSLVIQHKGFLCPASRALGNLFYW